LHDIWSDVPTSIAVSYGLLTPEDGAAMLDRHWAELGKTGFKMFEVGLPLNLRPIPPSLMLQGYGGQKEDGRIAITTLLGALRRIPDLRRATTPHLPAR